MAVERLLCKNATFSLILFLSPTHLSSFYIKILGGSSPTSWYSSKDHLVDSLMGFFSCDSHQTCNQTMIHVIVKFWTLPI